jgi:hypothetical protein
MTYLCVSCTWSSHWAISKLTLTIFLVISSERWAVEVPLQDCVGVGILNFFVMIGQTGRVTHWSNIETSSANSKRFRRLSSFQLFSLVLISLGWGFQQLRSQINRQDRPSNPITCWRVLTTWYWRSLPDHGVLPSTCCSCGAISDIRSLLLLLGANSRSSNLRVGKDLTIGILKWI